jgi:glycosyltransferase involved in cell wall biosynthesis
MSFEEHNRSMNKQSFAGRIAFFPPPSFGSNIIRSPAVYSLLRLLAEDGIVVDVFTESSIIGRDKHLEPIHNVYAISSEQDSSDWSKKPSRLDKVKRSLLLRPFLIGKIRLRGMLNWIKKRLAIHSSQYDPRQLVAKKSFLSTIDQHISGHKYDLVIGIDEEGIILAHYSLPEVVLMCYSLELYTEEHPHPHYNNDRLFYGRMKMLQRQAFKQINAVLVQDHDRARFLFQDMHQPYDPEKVLTFPVSYVGKAHRYRDDFLRQRFPDIGERTILLQFGRIMQKRCSPELIRSTRQCPSDMVVIFHGPFDLASRDMLSSAQCLVSQPDIPFEELEKIPASADIGLVFYKDISMNNRLVARSSGQLSLFMKCGVPVIVNDTPSMRSLVETYHCGVAVQSPDQIYEASRQILKNYEEYCQGSLHCFAQEHDLHRHYEQLRTKLLSFKI